MCLTRLRRGDWISYNAPAARRFCPKYRKPYLLRFENLIRKCILTIKFQFIIAEIDVMPDHVHLFIKCKTTTNYIPKIVGHLKGFSSFTIRKTYPALHLRTLKTPIFFK